MSVSVNDWLKHIQGVLLPPHCVLCGGAGQPPGLDLCAPCAADLPPNRHACRQCAAPLPPEVPPGASCGACLKRPPSFDGAVVPFRYAWPLDHLVRELKYHGRLAHGRVLGTLLAAHLRTHAVALPSLILPVPLHPARHRDRGFNQSGEIARYVASQLGVALDERSCVRVRATEDQALLSARDRRRNVRRAFALTGRLRCAHVAILDDVLTTGSTADELARVLKRGGVRQVSVWAIARAAPAHPRNR
jgi:ComF family protein